MAISPARKPTKSAKGAATATARRKQPLPFLVEGMITLTPEEAWEAYDAEARELLGMSAEEFDRMLETQPLPDEDRFVRVSMRRCPKPS